MNRLKCHLQLVTIMGLLLTKQVLANQPNIVFILADDLGWNDISYHGSEIRTPNIDQLAAEGVKLENYYVQHLCTPSRSAIMSGRYPIHTGLQHFVLLPCQANGLPLTDPTVADKLREVGYTNHAIGKWHLGFFQEAYTPTRRGFDSFQGYYNANEDYYSRETTFIGIGVDYHLNTTASNTTYGEYSPLLYARKAQELIENHNQEKPLFMYLAFQSVHFPVQAPKEYENRFAFIKDTNRRIFAGMVSALDDAIGNVTTTLKESGMWNNTVLIFSTDNGGDYAFGGNNAPLRGNKNTLWEGGVHGAGFVAGPLLKTKGVTSKELIHVSDWFPTIIRLGGGTLDGTSPDGFDQWDTINLGQPSPRKEILHNIDPLIPKQGSSVSPVFDTSISAALRYGDWKILTGNPGFDGWVPEPKVHQNRSFKVHHKASATQNVFLFNIAEDPTEHTDLSQAHPDIVASLLERLAFYNQTAVPPRYPSEDPRCAPYLHKGFWVPWM